MFFTQAARQLTLRIALLVMLLAALAPTFSHAMRAAGSDVLVEVCSAVGATWVTASPTEAQDTAPATTAMLDDCPYCILQGHSAALPSAPVGGLATKTLQFCVPLLFLHAPHTLHAWVTAQPRAPPRAT
jgi:hypothetical protein